ncbi:pyridine nucleotide-disulfide oxidoreductase [Dongia mobilis]|uniref:Pyridine nucleotide-disulfide oxidoreductase n=1 Tax=Dongia mobilis TaxID=578943 RepID=A0A4R6X2M9_9PROT|nr:FAD-dependent oxidoreductase [Dongia mobilis]TDQ86342.1 pyridine nucleotide-disulfide oxidoreductase [Dongia mobilis]
MSELKLAHGLVLEDLYAPAGLARLDGIFLDQLAAGDAALAARLQAARTDPAALDPKAESQLILDLAGAVEDFIGDLFGVTAALNDLRARHNDLAPLYTCKRLFVQRRALKAYGGEKASGLDGAVLRAALEPHLGTGFDELAFARAVESWQQDEAAHAAQLDLAAQYAAWATLTEAGRAQHRAGILFKAPRKLEAEHLVHAETETRHGVPAYKFPPERLRPREGFALTDAGTDLRGALDQANYCIWCHNQGKDSCAKGLHEKDGSYKKSVFGVTLAGCPLEEKISEMHVAKANAQPLAALAIIAIDNPMAAATGHRICNDCMKACIYQKQEPVDIPQAETRTLKDVLALPWGFEIYSLLTRWNPLNFRQPVAKPDSGRKVLVVGLGPAGYTLAHYLLNDGHTVVAIDGLKIEPLDAAISGVAPDGSRVPFHPIRDLAELTEDLGSRVMAGFGGVAEYGITVRWDKNFLKVIRLLLERRQRFAMLGGVRFGGTVTLTQAWEMGFDHVALAMGAGKPTLLDMPGGLAKGVRMASDFLMALQLTGAAKTDSIANLQLRLPAVVIGGGLTAIDTATEAMAYYPLQVEKFLTRYETLAAEKGEVSLRAAWNPSELVIVDEFLAHARAIRAERARAAKAGEAPRISAMLQEWGGVTIAYRRRLIDSPSYTLNHEEVEKALEENIRFAENLTPTRIDTDEDGFASAIHLSDAAGAAHILPARAILVAAGTRPNTVLAREDADHFALDGQYFRALDAAGQVVTPEKLAKPNDVRVITMAEMDGRAVSFFGDLHPSFAGNVVKAMGSAKQGWPKVSAALARRPASAADPAAFLADLNRRLRARVRAVNRLTPNIVEVVVEAPQAAANFQPGEFYRLQNFETLAPRAADTRLAMEGLALTGAWTDLDHGLVGLIVLEMGGSSDLCARLEIGEPVILMGPTGAPTEIPKGETVLLAGGGLGNAVLFSIGRALRAAGCRVLYFAGYKKLADRYKVAEIEAAADIVIWSSDEAPGFTPTRPQDKSHTGNIVDSILAYADGRLGDTSIRLQDVDRIIAIGSDGMMAAVARARHEVLKPYLKEKHCALGSINSPMQCMMKEICAQCLQPHKDPVTGKESVVFSCFNQDQELDRVDFGALRQRLGQNAVQEKLTKAWIAHALGQLDREKAAE